MLRNLNDFLKCDLNALDGDAGKIKDFYFDDKSWVIRYLIVETGNWLATRKVLISPISVHQIDFEHHLVLVQQTKDKIKHSPAIDTELPVSRQHEVVYNGYYGYPFYWGGSGLWGAADYLSMLLPVYTESLTTPHGEGEKVERHDNPTYVDHHLRSLVEIEKYQVFVDGDMVGHVNGLLIDEANWSVRYLVVDTHHWWPSHEILVDIHHILSVNWDTQSVVVNLSQQAIRDAPLYDASEAYTYDNELALQNHYEASGFSLKV